MEQNQRNDAEINQCFLIDLIEERHDLIEYDGTVYTKSDALLESDFPMEKSRLISRYSDEAWGLWQRACVSFIARVRKTMEANRVVLVKNILATEHGDIYSKEKFDDCDEIEKANILLKRYYDFFEKHFAGIQCIDMTHDPLYITDNEYEYGCYPWHLNGLINRKIGKNIVMV